MKKGQKKITFEESSKDTNEQIPETNQEEFTTKKRKRTDSETVQSKSKKESKKKKNDVDGIAIDVTDAKSLLNVGDEDDEQTPVLEADKYLLKNFRLSPKTIAKLEKREIKSLFEIQALTFDHIYDGKDLIGRARTGMGKTLAFVLPLIEKMMEDPKSRGTKKLRVLVLAPVRELAKQISDEFESVTDFSVACFYGGIPISENIQKIRQGIDIIVATPGRINDLIERASLNLSTVDYVVLDEADKMLEMGFKEDVEKILSATKSTDVDKHRQIILFSATVPSWVKEISAKFMAHDKVIVDMVESSDKKASVDVRHIAIPCQRATLCAIILDLIAMYAGTIGRTIIFCGTKADCNAFVSNEDFKKECSVIHGDIPQQQREVMLQAFRDGKVKVLVATDVAARGLDMVVDLVIQIQPPVRKSGPVDVDTYVHRSGRTGRAGNKGVCITLYNGYQKKLLKQIESAVGNTFEWISAPSESNALNISALNAVEHTKSVDREVLPHYEEAAKKLLSQSKPQEAVSLLLALVTGYIKPPRARSMLTGHFDSVTFQFSSPTRIESFGLVFSAMKRFLDEEVAESVKGLTFTQDRLGVVFDAPKQHLEAFNSLCDVNSNFKVCEQLPLLEEKISRNDNRNGNYRGNNSRGGGGYGGGNRGRNGSSGGYNGSNGYEGNGGGRGRNNRDSNGGGYNGGDNRGGGYNGGSGGNRGYSAGRTGGFKFQDRDNSFSGQNNFRNNSNNGNGVAKHVKF